MDPATWVYGQLSPATEAALRSAYGALLLLQLIWTWPHARRFFTTEKYAGYIASSPLRDRFHTPAAAYVAMSVWTLVALALIANRFVLPASLLNFALSYYFFVHLRWQTILRGMGAPGHMNYWIAALLSFLALGDALAPDIPLRAIVVTAFRIDFAFIMIFAGIYKITSGYARSDGFERGLVNPWWGWWSRWLRRVPARSPAFTFADHCAYVTEIACGLSFLYPATAPYGAMLLAASFLGIGALIRLTFLAEMVAACCLLYVWPGTAADVWFGHVFAQAPVHVFNGGAARAIAWLLSAVLVAYVALLPLGYLTMTVNFYFRRRLPGPLQRFFDAWNRFFGLILWRVFTNDLINFYCEIYDRGAGRDDRRLRARWRFNHVGEFICLASLFTTLKYYPNEEALFRERIVRYARTLALDGSSAVFRYYRIEKGATAFACLPIAEFVVDPGMGTVERSVLDARYDVGATEPGSPIHTGGLPGSYAPGATR